jgi:hypothetical protein
MTTAKPREPKGVRSGGQYTVTRRKEAAVQLTDEEKRKQEFQGELNRPLTAGPT